jgi:hypothetical protein
MCCRSAGVVLIAMTLAAPGLAKQTRDAPASSSHIRPGSSRLERLLAEGAARSETLQGLTRALDATAWIVFLQEGQCPEKAAVACLLHVVGTYDGAPYMRVLVDTRRSHPDRVVALIGHELQHAVEVARAASVSDARSMLALFRRIGYVSAVGSGAAVYETHAAVRIEEQVRHELTMASR